jgi:hypothetical protein
MMIMFIVLQICSDYLPAPELDYYDAEGMANDDDDELYESVDKRYGDRKAAEEALDAADAKRKDRENRYDSTVEQGPRGDRGDFDSDDESLEDGVNREEGEEANLNLEAFDSPLREWIAEERTRREIQRRFERFLSSYYVGIEEVTKFIKGHDHMLIKPPLPSGLRISPPVYLPKIR